MNNKEKIKYIDLFAGCGGLSLGLGMAGLQGIFAIEKDSMAFTTFKHNLVDKKQSHFAWPKWLPKESVTIQEVLQCYHDHIKSLKGQIDLIVGGPPCQGFSLAGRRKSNDPRNKLSEEYIKMVELISPNFLILENVKGFNTSFKKFDGKNQVPYSILVRNKLEKLGYKIFSDYVCSAEYGVPQVRTRFIMIGIKQKLLKETLVNPFEILKNCREDFLISKGLPLEPISVHDAINDLTIGFNGTKYHSGGAEKGFKQIDYKATEINNKYLVLMRKDMGVVAPNSLRLARHKPSTVNKFRLIQSICKPGISLNDSMRQQLGTKKQAISVLNPDLPSKTLTTLPDDLLHYSEARILTVREMARIQSFPDSFDILGKYTTGGSRRTQECPRYTQVGNAVPPLLGEVLGLLITKLSSCIKDEI
ncbi:TPA: DNA cytosine methyltransferase [Enterobacter bugandensis]|nr:DNA cytosine methyltransferase [Enterobacter bugandensis]